MNHVASAAEFAAKVQALALNLRRDAVDPLTNVAANRGLRRFIVEHMDALMDCEELSAQTRDNAEAVAALRERRRPAFEGR